MNVSTILVQYVLPIIGTIAAAMVPKILHALSLMLDARAQESKVRATLARLMHMADIAMADLIPLGREWMAQAAADGKITDEEIEAGKKAALAKLKQLMGQHGLEEAKAILGIYAPVLESYLEGVVATVFNARTEIVVGTSAPVPASLLAAATRSP